MLVMKTPQKMQAWTRSAENHGLRIGLVPTQGCLHDGHASLLKIAREQCDRVVLSLFVNPLQFRKGAYEAYPRREEADLEIARSCGVDAVFLPDVEDLYPGVRSLDELFDLQSGLSGLRDPLDFTVDTIHGFQDLDYLRVPDRLVMRMDGAGYPWHFDGVVTVVKKLFEAVEPTQAYFGQKDIQQYAIIDALNNWLASGIEMVPVPVLREPDGVSSSSRLVLLDEVQRGIAASIGELLYEIATHRVGDSAEDVIRWFKDKSLSIDTQSNTLEIDLVECVHPTTLESHDRIQRASAFYVAYLINGIRLAETRRCDE